MLDGCARLICNCFGTAARNEKSETSFASELFVIVMLMARIFASTSNINQLLLHFIFFKVLWFFMFFWDFEFLWDFKSFPGF